MTSDDMYIQHASLITDSTGIRFTGIERHFTPDLVCPLLILPRQEMNPAKMS